MMRRLRIARLGAILALLLGLAGCGDLPHPFQNNPGRTAARLSVPPPPRLAVPASNAASLPGPAGALLSHDLSSALLAQDVPAVAAAPRAGDWWLRTRAAEAGGLVTPQFDVLNPQGQVQGSFEGAAVPAVAWSAGDPAALQRMAEAAAPGLAGLLTGIQAAAMQSDPHSLMNRPARIYFSGVHGAPGDGNLALARQMAVLLPDGGNVVQNNPKGADFSLAGTVRMHRLNRSTDHVEIVWTVRDAGGKEAGKVAQLNDIPAHTLDTFWGDVALVVAQQAAPGVREVITNNSGRAHRPVHPPGHTRVANDAAPGSRHGS